MMMDYAVENTATSIYHDTVSVGGGATFPQVQTQSRTRTESVNLESDQSLFVEISDAMSDKDKVLFTIHTKTTLSEFQSHESSVRRTHEEFVWLHDHLVEDEAYAGLIVPPGPPKPDFDASRSKLYRLGESEGTVTKEDLQKMKAELEAEYLATFKKTVAMHEVFLRRLAAHPTFRYDHSFRVFLEYDGDLSVRNKTKKEKAADFIKSVTKSADEALRLTNQRDEDHFFLEEKTTLSAYHSAVKEATAAADAAVRQRRTVTETLFRLQLALTNLVPKDKLNLPETDLATALVHFFEGLQKLQARLASDEDLKLSDTLRYYSSDSGAAKDLLYRRSRALADLEAANRALDKARARMRDVQVATEAQSTAHERFNAISESARLELEDFKVRRIRYFQKNLIDLAELQVKNTKAQISLLKSSLVELKSVQATYTTPDVVVPSAPPLDSSVP